MTDPKTIWFDPALRELLLRGTGKPWRDTAPEEIPDTIIPVVARLANPLQPVSDLDIRARFGSIVTARAPMNRLAAIRADENVLSLKASLNFGADLTQSVSAIRATRRDLSALSRPPVSGRGVLVGIADWGCDFNHESFRREDGTSRILAIWDQRGASGAASPSPFGYGREIRSDEINAALETSDPNAALGYDSTAIDPAGQGTHGTHVMDIAGGSGAEPGVAPGVEFLFVHLMGNDTRAQDTLGDSVRLLEAVRYLKDKAGDRPIVINLSLGRTGGPKDGSTLVEQGLDALLEEGPGCAIVMSTGNYFNAGLHAAGRLGTGQSRDLEWQIPDSRSEPAELELWYSGSDSFIAELVDPNGFAVLRAGPNEEAILRSEKAIEATLYHRAYDPNNGDNQINVFLWPAATPGSWRLRVSSESSADGRYHAYIERSSPRFQSNFAPESREPFGTTNTICNGRNTIAVGAVDPSRPGFPSPGFSSAGPTRDGRRKPDCAAPGSAILAARSGGGRVRKSGTSMAAPHVTGTVALMFEAALPIKLPIATTRRILFESCRPIASPRAKWRSGAGVIDALAAVRGARSHSVAALAQRQTFNQEHEELTMPLIDSVKKICTRLAPLGWRPLLLKHGLDITAVDLGKELAKPLSIDRSQPGFEDFSAEGTRGIEPGFPARSLLFHALACTGVAKRPDGAALGGFPTWAEINTVENFVYAARNASFEDLKKAYGSNLGVVVFSVEYRGKRRSTHRAHGDQVFSRMGVARVGTAPLRYLELSRGFTPLDKENSSNVRVTPARYVPYIAVKRKPAGGAPIMHPQTGDANREFWMPVHKLFSGSECLRGIKLDVSLSMCHYNEKLKRLRQFLGQTSGVDLDKPPFVIASGLADWADESKHGPGVVAPVPRPRLVDFAKLPDGKYATFKVTSKLSAGPIFASRGVPISTVDNALTRPAPEWLNIRYVLKNGKPEPLTAQAGTDVVETISAGGYEAVHWLDYTGEGWITPIVKPEIATGLPTVPAYSVLSAPDFFPFCDQLQLTEWAESLSVTGEIWSRAPIPLSDVRRPFNLQTPSPRFQPSDITGTAIVGIPYPAKPAEVKSGGRLRAASWLPDTAAGIHAPGWDVSLAAKGNVPHYANYSLGSPFPEDAQLCAALSAFWPAVAPDTTRKYFFGSTNQYTVAPMTDDELGVSGATGFDGVPGATRKLVGGKRIIQFPRGAYVDYAERLLNKKFNFHLTSQVDFVEYRTRILAVNSAYDHVQAPSSAERPAWAVYSFRKVQPSDAELRRIAGTRPFSDPVYRVEFAKGSLAPVVAGSATRNYEVSSAKVVFVNPLQAGQIASANL